MDNKDFLKFNKEILSLKLSITNACNCRCKYCFVDKKNDFMNLETAQRAIYFFVSSPGQKKALILYGGEPLLNPFWKEIVLVGRHTADLLGKKLIIVLATNGLLLNNESLFFLKKHKVGLTISIDGKKKFNDTNRMFINNKSTFNLLLQKIRLAFKILGQENLSALMTISPDLSKYLYENFLSVIKLGFSSTHICPIGGVDWGQQQQNDFVLNFQKITEFCFQSIKDKKFIFLCPLFNPFTAEWIDQKKYQNNILCPFYVNLEIYPNGEISFSQFLINSSDDQVRNQAIIGNINDNSLLTRYQKCKPSLSSKKCQNCLVNYYGVLADSKFKGDDLIIKRDGIIKKMNDKIYLDLLKGSKYKDYHKKAQNLMGKLIV
ncbi:radical SAM protein [Patescibacteria group bacterium]|nr:radical SAM protein [Patescibacteria group bacterium]